MRACVCVHVSDRPVCWPAAKCLVSADAAAIMISASLVLIDVEDSRLGADDMPSTNAGTMPQASHPSVFDPRYGRALREH